MGNKKLSYLLFSNIISLAGYYFFVPLYAIFATRLGAAPKDIALLWSLYSLIMAVMIVVFGKVENSLNKARMVVLGFSLYACGSLLFLTVHSFRQLAIVLLINSVGAGILLPSYKALYAKSQDHGKEPEEWSFLDSSNMLAVALGSAAGGLIIGRYGFNGIFVSMAFVQALAAIIAYSGLRRHRRRLLKKSSL